MAYLLRGVTVPRTDSNPNSNPNPNPSPSPNPNPGPNLTLNLVLTPALTLLRLTGAASSSLESAQHSHTRCSASSRRAWWYWAAGVCLTKPTRQSRFSVPRSLRPRSSRTPPSTYASRSSRSCWRSSGTRRRSACTNRTRPRFQNPQATLRQSLRESAGYFPAGYFSHLYRLNLYLYLLKQSQFAVLRAHTVSHAIALVKMQ